ncbi:hypothetical protein [Shewanella donghaensis]|uniref:hypothetical protein n=1 Tax=Shewanella donghaensis TaxID=238836 RepID=UPI001181EE8F|nr:hypothetical protein [Shewanella donghaensis]
MTPFTITRLHTQFGIIKASGQWHTNSTTDTQFNQLEQMSTDGWIALDINHPANSQFIAAIQPEVHQHLLSLPPA